MYMIPDFSGGGTRQAGSNLINAGQFSSGTPGGSSSTQNQYMTFPAMTTMPNTGGPLDGGGSPGGSPFFPMGTPSAPGIVSPSGPGQPVDPATAGGIGSKGNLGRAGVTTPTVDPTFTKTFADWLQSMLGKGATPFDLSAVLPSTGQATAPGTLTAPENPILQSLQKFFQTGEGGPLPGVLPMWQSAMKAMQIPIEQQLANIKEQFGARGTLGSSEMAQALETFGSQTAADQEALLGQLTLQALPGMEQFGAGLQSMDQASIDRLVQEFMRTRPEYSPLLSPEFGFATTYPPVAGKGGGFMSAFSQSLGQGLGDFVTGHTGMIPG